MLPVNSDRDTAIEFFDCLVSGQAVRPASEQAGWTADEMLQLAGACFLFLSVLGMCVHQNESRNSEASTRPHPEHEEAGIETVMSDVHATVDFVAQLTQLAHDGAYDREYEPLVRCRVGAAESWGGASVVPVAGFKGRRDR